MYDIRVLASGVTLTRQGTGQVVGCVTNYALVRGVTHILAWYPVWVSGETLTLPGGCKPRISLFMIRVKSGGVRRQKGNGPGPSSYCCCPRPSGATILVPGASSMSMPASFRSGAQKFQLGPVVPAGIVRRILRGDYIDMAELSE